MTMRKPKSANMIVNIDGHVIQVGSEDCAGLTVEQVVDHLAQTVKDRISRLPKHETHD